MRSLKRTPAPPVRPLPRPSGTGLAPHPRMASLTTQCAPSTPAPISSLLIANRGEIALRIARTAAQMGIRTTTVYTTVDAAAQHARIPSAAASLALPSYLDAAAIVDLARARGIQALHPGYGFLSENAAFAKLCEDAGITFIGPPAQAISDMGDKARSKGIMTRAGVPCVPGYHGAEQEAVQLAARAAQVGYPVLLKSVKGGGGKGMRIVKTPGEFAAQLKSARQEASASFGTDGEVMLVERYVVRPRHVEVQVFADRHGNCVALGERDCSVQRRHQKVLEESPAPGLDDATRKDLWERARTAALAVGYVGAGTVEFILDRDTGEFFFMEMNTRLQVEHPVSEMVTGTDLVEWQFRVAGGERLPLTQDEIEQRILARGHAIEARIYAENPDKGFLPDSGRLVHLATPTPSADVRIDAGFAEGDVVSEAYDGMIAKLIVRGTNRETAVRRMEMVLREYEVVGPATNIEFLKRLCRSPAFLEGDVETGFIDKWRDELFTKVETPEEVFAQAALGLLSSSAAARPSATSGGPHGVALGFGETGIPMTQRRFTFCVRDDTSPDPDAGPAVDVTVTQKAHQRYDVAVTRRPGSASATNPEPVVYQDIVSSASTTPATTSNCATKTHLATLFPAQRITSTLVQNADRSTVGAVALTLFQHGVKHQLTLLPPAWAGMALGVHEGGISGSSVVAPMPCKILRNEVAEGEAVEEGQALVVIESMKMETVIRSPRDGVIGKLLHEEGDICKAGTVLVMLKKDSEDQ